MPVERTSAGSPAHRIGGKSSRVLTPAQACGVAAVGLAALENLLVALTASRPRRRGNRCEGSREAAEGEEALRLAVAPILRHLKSARVRPRFITVSGDRLRGSGGAAVHCRLLVQLR
jgi:hypothetical protein